MAKKYLNVSFDLANSKKRSVTVKNVQSESTDENLKKLGEFVEIILAFLTPVTFKSFFAKTDL